MINKKMFNKWMSLFGELFDTEISDILKDSYWEFLQPFNDEQCEKGFKKIFTTSRVFPETIDFITAWKQIEFEEIYQNICHRKDLKFPDHLPGIHEQTNMATQKIGYDVAIVMIGEPMERKMLKERYPEG